MINDHSLMVPFDSFQHFTVGRRQYSTDGPEFSNLGQVFDRISSVKSADMVKKVNARYAHKRNFLKSIFKNIEISPGLTIPFWCIVSERGSLFTAS